MGKIFRQWSRQQILALFLVIVVSVLAVGRASAAVTVSSFTAKAKISQILVEWTTATEINNSGFNLLRNTSASGTFTKIAGLIPSKNPGSIIGANYSYIDNAITPGQTFYYKLESLDSNGAKQQFGPVSAAASAAPATLTSTPAATATRPPSVQTSASTVTATHPPSVQTSAPTVTATRPPALQTSTPAKVPSAATAIPTPAVSPTPSPNAIKTATPSAKVAFAIGAATPTPLMNAKVVPPAPPTKLAQAQIVDAFGDTASETSEVDLENPSDSSAASNRLDRSYYLHRLIMTGIILSSGLLVLGSLTLGASALYFLVRAFLR